MREKRVKHERIIYKNKQTALVELKRQADEEHASDEEGATVEMAEQADDDEVKEAFSTVIAQKKRSSRKPFDPEQSKRKKLRLSQKSTKDEENYIPYISADHHGESGLALDNDFGRAATDAVLDFTGDDDQELRRQKSLMKWDRKKKKYVGQEDSKTRKIRTESGVWIPATYKTDRYQRWRDKTKVDLHDANENSGDEEPRSGPAFGGSGPGNRGQPRGMNLEGM